MLAAKKRRRKEKKREREECKKQRRAVIPFYVDCAAKLSAKAPLGTRHEAPFRRRLQARSGPCCLCLPAAIKTNANMKSKWNPFNLANKSDCQGSVPPAAVLAPLSLGSRGEKSVGILGLLFGLVNDLSAMETCRACEWKHEWTLIRLNFKAHTTPRTKFNNKQRVRDGERKLLANCHCGNAEWTFVVCEIMECLMESLGFFYARF